MSRTADANKIGCFFVSLLPTISYLFYRQMLFGINTELHRLEVYRFPENSDVYVHTSKSLKEKPLSTTNFVFKKLFGVICKHESNVFRL